MTIDSHSYLVSRGWKGKGSGLREGGISRPIAQAQKKDQKGLGKNRDDGFQFWDHVYAVAANAIHIHVEDSEEESENKEIVSSTRALATATKKTLAMTQTGILSNRRPHGDRQGASTDLFRPSGGGGGVGGDLLVLAKREAARRELYSRFHRGGVVHAREVAGFPGRIDPKTDGDETGEKWEPPPSVDGERADVGKESRRAEKRRRKEEHARRKGDRKKAKRGA